MTAPGHVEVDQVTVSVRGRPLVEDITLCAQPGQVIGIVGPNGSGKSTLLRAVIGILHPAAGSVLLNGRDIACCKPRHVARVLAAVLQDTTADFDLTGHDVVAMGRACHKRLFARDDAQDKEIVADALARVGATHLARHPFALMSGGERQRVLVARAIAQQPGVLVMDEPTNHLDVRHQFDVLSLPRRLGLTAVIALHDLNLAAHYCDEIHVLNHGRQWRSGAPDQVLAPDLIASVFGASSRVEPHPDTGRPYVTFTPSGP